MGEPSVEGEKVRRWSTGDVPTSSRLAYYSAALSEAIIPISVDLADTDNFRADLSLASLAGINICKVIASPHACIRSTAEMARTQDHKFQLLMVVNCAWNGEHRGRSRMMPHDIFIHDTSYPLKLDIREASVGINVAVSESWLRRWVPNPGVLVGKRIAAQSPWGSALCAYVAELSPQLVEAPPLPPLVLTDQIGSLLALATHSQLAESIPEYTVVTRSLHERIVDCLLQRCSEPKLTAGDVAASANISLRTLHRTLAAAGRTFGTLLVDARVRAAERMLVSPAFRHVTTAEIGRRSGFLSASHFVRAVRRSTGRTPLQLRRVAIG